MTAFYLKRHHEADPFEVIWSQKFHFSWIFTVIGNTSNTPFTSFSYIQICLNTEKGIAFMCPQGYNL